MNKKLYINIENFWSNFLLLMQFCACAVYMITGSELWLYIRAILALIVLCYFFLVVKKDIKIKQKILIMVIYVIILMICNILFVGNYRIITIFRNMLPFFSTACLTSSTKINRKLFLIMYYCMAIYVLYCTFILKQTRIFASESSNYISVFLAIMLLPYYFSYDGDREAPSMLPAIICFIPSVYVMGRSGIIMAAALLVGTCIKNIFDTRIERKVKKKVWIFSAGIVIVLLYVLLYTDIFSTYLYRFTLLKEGVFLDSGRISIWTEYFSQLEKSLYFIIAGFPVSSSEILTSFLNNLHNSFMMTHAYLGILGVIALVICIYKGLRFLFISRQYDAFILCFCILLRCMSDWVFPFHIGDIVIWMLVIYPVINSKRFLKKQYEENEV